jgi:hypothetical protein
MSKKVATALGAFLLAGLGAGAIAAAPSAGALGGNLECDTTASHLIICDLGAQGQQDALTNEQWTFLGQAAGTGSSKIFHCYDARVRYTVTVTYQQAGQAITESQDNYCNVGMSQ